jgi:hypothetical protein
MTAEAAMIATPGRFRLRFASADCGGNDQKMPGGAG